MGWSGGSEIVGRLARVVEEVIDSPVVKRQIYDELIEAVIDLDCDTVDECRGMSLELDASIDDRWGTYDED
jgi:hypothetical protein